VTLLETAETEGRLKIKLIESAIGHLPTAVTNVVELEKSCFSSETGEPIAPTIQRRSEFELLSEKEHLLALKADFDNRIADIDFLLAKFPIKEVIEEIEEIEG